MRSTSLALCAALLLPMLPVPVSGQSGTPMTAEEFDAYVTGRTLTYGIGGTAYGIEQYLPGRRVLWAFVADECREGVWYPQGQEICFVYDYDPDNPQCWLFWQSEDGLVAQFMNDGGMTELVEVDQSDGPLTCAGPLVGV